MSMPAVTPSFNVPAVHSRPLLPSCAHWSNARHKTLHPDPSQFFSSANQVKQELGTGRTALVQSSHTSRIVCKHVHHSSGEIPHAASFFKASTIFLNSLHLEELSLASGSHVPMWYFVPDFTSCASKTFSRNVSKSVNDVVDLERPS